MTSFFAGSLSKKKNKRRIKNNISKLFFSIFDIKASEEQYIKWHQSLRKGKFLFINIDELDNIKPLKPVEDEIDFCLYIILPLPSENLDQNNINDLNGNDPRILFWYPDQLSLSNYKVFKEYINRKDKVFLKDKVKSIIKKIYLNGVIKNDQQKYDYLKNDNLNFVLNNLIKKQLDRSYPEYQVINKRFFQITPCDLRKHFSNSNLIKKLMDIIDDGKYYYLKEEIYPIFRSKPFGLCPLTFKYLLLYAYFEGKCRLFDSDKRIITINNFSPQEFNNVFSGIKTIGRGELLEEKYWDELLQMVKGFDFEITNFRRNLKTQDYLWQVLIDIQSRYKEEIKHAIRVNSRLCHLLEEELQLMEVNSCLFKMHNLFDREFYVLARDSRPGIRKFLNIFNNIFEDIESFLEELTSVKLILKFVQNQKDKKLIREYNYLKNISLPIKGYEDLRMNLFTILKSFDQLLPIIISEHNFKKLMADIKKFKKVYRHKYQQEHYIFYKKLNDFKNKLHSLPEFRLLQKMKSINLVDFHPVQDYLDSFFPSGCENDNFDNLLKEQPKCNCGFNIGESLIVPSLDKIVPMLKKEIRVYIKQLQNSDYFKKHLELSSDSSVSHILKNDSEIIPRSLIDRELIAELNEILEKICTVNISLKEVSSVLSDSYSLNQLDCSIKTKLISIIQNNIKKDEEMVADSNKIIINFVE